MVLAFGLAIVMNLGSYWFSDRIVLAMYRAQGVGPSEHPELHRRCAGSRSPRGCRCRGCSSCPSPGLNAFATGRNPQHAIVAVTEGLLAHLDGPELEGVLAHELAHVKNRDILVSAIAATLAGAIMFIADMARWASIFGGFGGRDSEEGGNPLALLVAAIVAPLAALLVQMAISRSREYQADAIGPACSAAARVWPALSRSFRPPGACSRPRPPRPQAMSHRQPALRQRPLLDVLTHPPIEERIARLRRFRRGA